MRKDKYPKDKHNQGMSLVEISQALGISYNCAKETLRIACAKLEKIFRENGARIDLEELIELKQRKD